MKAEPIGSHSRQQFERFDKDTPLPTLRRTGPWIIAGTILGVAGIVAHLRAQADVTTASAGGPGGNPFTLACPDQMILIGIHGGYGSYEDSIQGVCSRYNAEGRRIGDPVITQTAGDGPVRWRSADDLPGQLCPEDQALSRFSGNAGIYIDRLFAGCAPVGFDGRRSRTTADVSSVGFGTSGGGRPFNLLCPNATFAHAITGRADQLVDRIALVCNVAPLAATKLRAVTLSRRVGISGTPIPGTVALNGYALGNVEVALREVLAPINSVPSSVTINAGESSASFQFSSSVTYAGCPSVIATALNTSDTTTALLTPPPPANATFEFRLVDPPSDFTYIVPRPISAQITFGKGRSDTPLSAGSSGAVSFKSNSRAVTVPASVPYSASTTRIDVTMTAVTAGCAVVTATRDTMSIRKTIRTVLVGG